MRTVSKLLIIFGACWLVGTEACSAQTIPSSNLTLSVSENGDVVVTISASAQQQPSSSTSNLLLIALPVALDSRAHIKTPSDVHAVPLDIGQSYTVLVVSKPPTSQSVKIEIESGMRISETADGRGKVEFSPLLPFIPQSERELLQLPFSISTFDVDVILPKRYDPADINTSPPFSPKNDTTFQLSFAQVKQSNPPVAWIAFPNPMQHELDISKLVFGACFGLLGIAISTSSLNLRERGTVVVWLILVVSMIVVGIGLYFLFGLSQAKRIEFLILSIAALFTAIWTALLCGYSLLARAKQAVVAGRVNVDGGPAIFVDDLKLLRVDTNPEKMVGRKEELKPVGQYFFYLWSTSPGRRYRVRVEQRGARAESPDFGAQAGKRHTVAPISFVSVPKVEGMSQAAASAAITGVGLSVGTVTQQRSNTVISGHAINQNPASGSSVVQGSSIDLVISSGP